MKWALFFRLLFHNTSTLLVALWSIFLDSSSSDNCYSNGHRQKERIRQAEMSNKTKSSLISAEVHNSSMRRSTVKLRTCVNIELNYLERHALLDANPQHTVCGPLVYRNNVYDLDINSIDRETDYNDIERIMAYLNHQFVPARRCRNKNRRKDEVPQELKHGYFSVFRYNIVHNDYLSIGIEDYPDGKTFLSAQVFYEMMGKQ